MQEAEELTLKRRTSEREALQRIKSLIVEADKTNGETEIKDDILGGSLP